VLLAALREALSNVKKHSGAERVRVTLSRIDEWVALDVCDDGTGGGVSTDAALPPAGFGLTSLRRRVEEIGGRLVLEFTAQAGSTLSVQLPERGRM
jgi:signal transduction histidine kinase